MRECKIFIHRISELYKKDTTVYFSTISPREADLPPHKKAAPEGAAANRAGIIQARPGKGSCIPAPAGREVGFPLP